MTDQEMGAMEEKTNFRSTAFDGACQTILTACPEAIGVAFKFLDCGCSLLCGVSAQGNPVGELIHVSGQTARKGKKTADLLYMQKGWRRGTGHLGRDSLARR